MHTFGVRAHDFGTLPPDQLAAAIARVPGASCVQLALRKALTGIATTPAELGAAGARGIRAAFDRRGLSIAVLGCYIDPVDPDAAERDRALALFEDHLRAAADFGCRIVGTETGPAASERAAEKAFGTLVSSIKRLARTAEESGAIVGVEAVAERHTVWSTALMRKLLDAVDSPAVGVIFDPTNLVPRTGLASQERFLDECFAAFGDRIVAVHAKDYTIVEGSCGPVKSPPLAAGTGELDWAAVFRRLREAGADSVPVLLENAGPDEAAAAIGRLQAAR
jgi:sugar phosphate isomerase/epimerase